MAQNKGIALQDPFLKRTEKRANSSINLPR